MEHRARLTGYASASLLLLLILWLATAVCHDAFHPRRVIQVRFPELGTLMVEDPVLENGVPAGKVRKVEFRQGIAVVELEMFRREFIAADARFVDFNYSLMGARRIVLLPGHSRISMDESQSQTGVFLDGVAETIHRVGELMGLVADLRAQSRRLFEGTNAPLSPALLATLDNDARAMNRLAERIDATGKSLHAGLDAWVRLENSIPAGLKNVQAGLNAAENQTASLLNAASSAERNADGILSTVEKLIASTRDSTGTAHALLYDRSAYDELVSSLNILDAALKTFQEKGLNGAVKWRNLHFFNSGTP